MSTFFRITDSKVISAVSWLVVLGSNILSGGEEGVLVMWQYSTHHKEFLPRLGAPINHLAISPDDSLTAVSQKENGMLLYKAAVSGCTYTVSVLWDVKFLKI